jgi:hypothetical protein
VTSSLGIEPVAPHSPQVTCAERAGRQGWPYSLVAIARTTPTMMSPNPPKIASNPLSSQLVPSFLALARAVRTNPASTPTSPSWVNKDGISRDLLAGCQAPDRLPIGTPVTPRTPSQSLPTLDVTQSCKRS